MASITTFERALLFCSVLLIIASVSAVGSKGHQEFRDLYCRQCFRYRLVLHEGVIGLTGKDYKESED